MATIHISGPNDTPRNEAPRGVSPRPVPVEITVDQVGTPQEPLVLLRFYTAADMGAYFLPIEAARRVAQMINKSATIVRLN